MNKQKTAQHSDAASQQDENPEEAARAFMDLWQQQMAGMFQDPEMIKASLMLVQRMQSAYLGMAPTHAQPEDASNTNNPHAGAGQTTTEHAHDAGRPHHFTGVPGQGAGWPSAFQGGFQGGFPSFGAGFFPGYGPGMAPGGAHASTGNDGAAAMARDGQLAELTNRLAACERRIATLERLLEGSRERAEKNPRESRHRHARRPRRK